eukprot:1156721-Heterocapsa_arctica.AAC.1
MQERLLSIRVMQVLNSVIVNLQAMTDVELAFVLLDRGWKSHGPRTGRSRPWMRSSVPCPSSAASMDACTT